MLLSIDYVDNLLLINVRSCANDSSLLDVILVSTSRIIGREIQKHYRISDFKIVCVCIVVVIYSIS
jgi:hypothetical protein